MLYAKYIMVCIVKSGHLIGIEQQTTESCVKLVSEQNLLTKLVLMIKCCLTATFHLEIQIAHSHFQPSTREKLGPIRKLCVNEDISLLIISLFNYFFPLHQCHHVSNLWPFCLSLYSYVILHSM